MKSTIAVISLLACVALVNSGIIPARQMNTNINENDNSDSNILFDFLVSIVESGPQKPSPTHRPKPPTYKPKPPTYKPRPPTYKPTSPTYKPTYPTYKPTSPTYKPTYPTYKPTPPTYKPKPPTIAPYQPTTTEYYQEKTTKYTSGRPNYATPTKKPYCKDCSTYPTPYGSIGEKPTPFDFVVPTVFDLDGLFDIKMGKDAESGTKSNEAMEPMSETSKMQSAMFEVEN